MSLSKPPRDISNNQAAIRWFNDLWRTVTSESISEQVAEVIVKETIIERVSAGNPFDQDLNKANDVEFNKITMNNTDLFRYLFMAGG